MPEIIKKNIYFIGLLAYFCFFTFAYKPLKDNTFFIGFDWVFVLGILVGLILFFLAFIKKAKIFSSMGLFEKLLVIIFTSYALSTIVCSPILFYNQKAMDAQSLKTEYCELLKTSTTRMSRGLYIKFQDEPLFIRGHEKIYNSFENGSIKMADYKMKLIFKEGFLNTLNIRSKSIVEAK